MWDTSYCGPYDAVARRKASGIKSTSAELATVKLLTTNGAAKLVATSNPLLISGTSVARHNSSPTSLAPIKGTVASANYNSSQQKEAFLDLNKQVTELKICIDRVEKERDFYFGKLRDVEIMCQQVEETDENNAFVQKILDIL